MVVELDLSRLRAIRRWVEGRGEMLEFEAARREVREMWRKRGLEGMKARDEYRPALELMGVDWGEMCAGLFGDGNAALERERVVSELVEAGSIAGEVEERVEDDGRVVHAHEAIEWVAEHLDDETVSRCHAPSGAAWSMLRWARTDDKTRELFWTRNYQQTVIPKAERKRKMDSEVGGDVDHRAVLERLSRMGG